MAETKYIVFRLGEQKYAVRLEKINGIEETYQIIPVPMGMEYIKGIIHLREDVIPIYNLKKRFDVEDEGPSQTRQLLVAETHGIRLGVEVDQVLGIVSIDDKDIKGMPVVVQSEETACLENVVKVTLEAGEPGIVISVSLDYIMSDAEFENVSNAVEETIGE